jgi:cobalamin-dependent methionine synthase I
MLIAGEKLNSSISSVKEAVARRDAAFITQLARQQLDCGAHYLDINAGVFMEEEGEALKWLVTTIQSQMPARVMVDSTRPAAVQQALQADSSHDAIINSVTLDPKRFDGIVPIAVEFGAGVVALPIDTGNIPHTAEGRLQNAEMLLNRLVQAGIMRDKIYLDPLVMAASTEGTSAATTLETIRLMKANFPDVHVIGGMSNVSFGLPERKLINRTFLAAAILAGLDAAIIDITDRAVKDTLMAALALAGRDEYCLGYIQYCREKE